ncbi:putative dispersed gene family protein 1 (DGF-1), partial [Trypanosoma cruzi]
MPTYVREERRLFCWRTANSSPLFRVTISSFDALDGRRFQRCHVVLSRPLFVFRGIGTALWWSLLPARAVLIAICLFCWDGATLYGCVGLHGRWEGDGVNGVVSSALFFVGGFALAGTVCGRMPPRTTVFICCCFRLFIPFLKKQLEILWLDQHNYRFKVLGVTCGIRIGSSGITIWRNCVSGFPICRKGFVRQELRSTGRVRYATTALLVPVWVGGCGLLWVRVRA